MKRTALVVAIAWMMIITSAAWCAKTSPTLPQKPRVAVIEFEVRDGPYNIGKIACDALSEQLVKSGRFAVYERARLKQVLEEHRLPMVGIVDPSTAVQIGKWTGVQIVLCGAIQSASTDTSYSTDRKGRSTQTTTAKVTVHGKAIDAADDSIWVEETVEGSESYFGSTHDHSGLLARAAREAAGKLVTRLVPPLTGYVVKVNSDRDNGYFFIDLGSRQGVGPDSEFRVEREGEVIRDRQGKVLGREWHTVCLAHPVGDGVSENMTKLCPGRWERPIPLLAKKWKWDRSKLTEIQVGLRVTAQPRAN